MLDFTNFKFIKTIGVGTFGRVYLAQLLNPKISKKKFYALKILPKSTLLKLRQIDHYKNEKNTLATCKNHPFIVNLMLATEINEFHVMMMEFIPGGELFSWIKRYRRFDINTIRFYSAQLVLALEFLHSKDIMYRDLKPENLLLTHDGYLKLTDFGFAKQSKDLSYSFCGTPEYMAPEQLISHISDINKGHGKDVDFWSLGIILYEMYVGLPPFYSQETYDIYFKTANNEIEFFDGFDRNLQDLISGLTKKDWKMRIGHKNGFSEVKNHIFYKNLNWDDIYHKRIQAPFKPVLKNDWDTSYFINYPETIEKENGKQNPNTFMRIFPI